MRGVFGGFVCVCVGLTAPVAAQESVAPITTALAVEPAAPATDSHASPPLFKKLPLPRMRPANAPKPPAPNSPQDVCETLAAAAQKHRLPVAFFGNLIYQESGLKPRVVSRAGARGIAQFMPKTARMVGLKDPFNPRQALPASARFLRGLMHRFGNNYGLAAAAYNAGPGRVANWLKRGGALPRETRNYVMTITGKRAEQWRGKRGHAFDHDLTARIPCSNLRAFAELENNPASAHSVNPVKFVLPVPLPHPLRQASLAGHAPTPEMTVKLDVKLPEPAPKAPVEAPSASIAVLLPTPEVSRRATAPGDGSGEAAAYAPVESKAPAIMAAVAPVEQSKPIEQIKPVPALVTIGDPPMPRINPRRNVTPEATATVTQVAALAEPGKALTATITPLPIPRPAPRHLRGEIVETSEAAKSPALMLNPPLPRPHPLRLGVAAVKLDSGKIAARLPLPRARPLTLAQARKK